MAIETTQTKRKVTKRVSRRSGLIGKAHKKVRRSVSKGSELVIGAKKTVRRSASRGSEIVVEARKKVNRRVSRGFSKLKYLSPLHLKSRGVYQVKFETNTDYLRLCCCCCCCCRTNLN